MPNKAQSKKKGLEIFKDADKLVKQNRYLEAIEKYEKALSILPGNDHFNLGYLYYNLAVCNLSRIAHNKKRAIERKLVILFDTLDLFLKFKEKCSQILAELQQTCRELVRREAPDLIDELDENFIELLPKLRRKFKDSFKEVEKKFSDLLIKNEIGFDGKVIRFHTELIEIWDEIINISQEESVSLLFLSKYKQSMYSYLTKLIPELLESYYLMTDDDLEQTEKDWSLPVEGTEALLLAVMDDIKMRNNKSLEESIALFLLYYYRKYGDVASKSEKTYDIAIKHYRAALRYADLAPKNECRWYQYNIYYNLGVCYSEIQHFSYENAKDCYSKSKQLLCNVAVKNNVDDLQIIDSALKELEEKNTSFNHSSKATSYQKINKALQRRSNKRASVSVSAEKASEHMEIMSEEEMDIDIAYASCQDTYNSNSTIALNVNSSIRLHR